MPRSRGSRPAPRSAPASAPSGSRSASSVAAPPPVARAPPAASTGQPGMMAQMAATAGSVAVGSTVGHGISHMLFGGGGRAQEAGDSAPAAHQQTTASGGSCEFQAKEFTKCLDATGSDVQTCNWFLDQLKACQAAASRY